MKRSKDSGMKIRIPTKKYIKTFLEHPSNANHLLVANKLLALVLTNNKSIEWNYQDREQFETEIVIEISDYFIQNLKHGLCLQKINYFNQIMTDLIRDLIFEKIKTYLFFEKNIKKAIDHARHGLNIDEEDYTDEALNKYYQRNRERLNLPEIYKKNNQAIAC